MVIYIVQIILCFLNFMLNDSSFSCRKTLLIWKYKDLIKIFWRHKVHKMK